MSACLLLGGTAAASEVATRTSIRLALAGCGRKSLAHSRSARKQVTPTPSGGVRQHHGAYRHGKLSSSANAEHLSSSDRFPFAFNTVTRKPQLFDVDANVCHEQLRGDREVHMEKAHSVGVAAMLVPASCTASSVEIQSFAADCQLRHSASASASLPLPHVFTTAGIHPYEASDELTMAHPPKLDSELQILRKLLLKHPKTVVAVGECGLDYSNGFPSRDAQLPVFESQVQLACELQRPLFLHVRKAFKDCLRILDRWKIQNNNTIPPVLVHCFTGTCDELRDCLQRGYSLSVSGLICREEAGRELREALKTVYSEGLLNLSCIMVETDAPYLGFKGCRKGYKKGAKRQTPNVPSALPLVVDKLAKTLEVEACVLAEASSKNALNFFGIQDDFST